MSYRYNKFSSFRISNKEIFYIFITWVGLITFYYLKINSTQFLLRSDASNEPLIVLSNLFKNNFKNDDFYKLQPYPYIPLHKELLNLIWNNYNNAKYYYYTWLFTLIFITLISNFLLFRFFIKQTWISILFAIGLVVGVYSNYWSFSYIGISDFDSLIARTNFNFFIPLLILFYLEIWNQKKLILLFFFILGICVNIYPAIAINSSIIFYIVYFIYSKKPISLSYLLLPIVLYILGSFPFIYQSLKELNQINSSIINDPNVIIFTKNINELYKIKSEENSLGNFRGLFENFILYPPYLILTAFALLTKFKSNNLNEAEKKIIDIVFVLYVLSYILILVGWIMQHFNYTLPGILSLIPRFQYLGNFLIILGYLNISIFIKQLIANKELKYNSFINNTINFSYMCVSLVFLFIGYKGFNNIIIFPGAGLWLIFSFLIIFILAKKQTNLTIIITIIILLPILSGFSYSYDESVDFLIPPFRQIHRGLLVVLSSVFFILSLYYSYHKNLYNKLWIFLLLIPFSWAFIPRIWINISRVTNPTSKQIINDRRESDFVNIANWTKYNTPINSRFILSDKLLNGSRAINIFKTISLRSTPLLRGGEYFYYEKEGYNYACNLSDRFDNLLLNNKISNDKMKIFLNNINVDYFIIDNNYNYANQFIGITNIYENSNFSLYKIQ